jgi:hypothetical protein
MAGLIPIKNPALATKCEFERHPDTRGYRFTIDHRRRKLKLSKRIQCCLGKVFITQGLNRGVSNIPVRVYFSRQDPKTQSLSIPLPGCFLSCLQPGGEPSFLLSVFGDRV